MLAKDDLFQLLSEMKQEVKAMRSDMAKLLQHTEQDWIKVSFAAKELGVSNSRVYQLLEKYPIVQEGIDYKKFSKQGILIKKSSLNKIIQMRAKNV